MTKISKLDSLIIEAALLGKKAFNDGKMDVVALDPRMMEIFELITDLDDRYILIRSWLNSYDAAQERKLIDQRKN